MWDLIEEKRISLNYSYVPTKETSNDLLTKALPHLQHEYLTKTLRIY